MNPMKITAALLITLLAIAASQAADIQPGGVYRDIMQSKTLRIGISMDYPPLNFNAGEKGVEIEMARALGEFMGVQVKMVPLPVERYAAALEQREVDLVIAGFSRSLARAKSIWFSEPYLSVTPAILADSRSIPRATYGSEFEQTPMRTIWDLKRLTDFRFAVKKGSAYEGFLKTEFPGMSLVLVASNEEGMELLKNGSVNGFVHDSLYLEHLYGTSAKLRNSYVLLAGGARLEKICMGLPFGDTVLKQQVDIFILEIIRLGLIDRWLTQYSVER
ncbi:MAG TPA: transporter substrate-binding domain-containing protein [Spirochaetota bacterium]|nr:amino acid ABC transporter substrate-binding protein [Spirochaetota bacterium]HOD13147.1 transporter substrate-binding domain-containing protein [Spirochaetota bacterium]HPG49046.1 transporter substrate-binding domain-containing protein [Spirochaetota bacterium]HPN10514.1 transporter substrate-binding domain-containing protein [Spirochaetota bacterium]HQL81810.1 transporter substrate-binding domain-containing protein [Spirochaetota bacterium]